VSGGFPESALTPDRIEALVRPYLVDAPESLVVPPALFNQLAAYLSLLLRWNARTNLTSVREPGEIVQRHFGESLFAGVHLDGRLRPGATLLDVGSGAGFPGLPIQLLRPDLRVTLVESQGKKASFLREAVRTLGLGTEVVGARLETMQEGRRFDAVTLRAVDRMEGAVAMARDRVAPGGWLSVLCGPTAAGTDWEERFPVPRRSGAFLGLRRV
jgi:16S rRNA (guanine527-N7)-methyltransferase